MSETSGCGRDETKILATKHKEQLPILFFFLSERGFISISMLFVKTSDRNIEELSRWRNTISIFASDIHAAGWANKEDHWNQTPNLSVLGDLSTRW